ncbi:MAG: DNA-binding response regulator [Burkholderiales bacterium]|nr:MAG: DNA-binding response regulator [Burkholderiales bacterium]
MRVLVIEDDPVIGANVCDYLQTTGMDTRYAPDGIVGMEIAQRERPDVVVLDLNLPGIDGIDWCRRLRSGPLGVTPVLMLTARDSIDSKRAGFAAGADDYLVKPFLLDELAMRLRALSRRANGRATEVTTLGTLRLEREARRVRVGETLVRLTPRSFQLVDLLMSVPDRVFSRPDLEREIWGDEPPGGDALRALVAQTRRAFSEAGIDPIENLHGHGYRIRAPDPLA